MTTTRNINNLKRMEESKKFLKDLFTEFVAGEYQKILTEMETIFGEQLNSYIIGIFELNDFIENNKYYFNEEILEKTESIIKTIKQCEVVTRKRLEEMEEFFNQVENNNTRCDIEKMIKRLSLSGINNKTNKILFKNLLKSEINNMEKTLLIYYKDQRDNVTKYYEIFDLQNKIPDDFEKHFYGKESNLSLQEKDDVKRFTCTYEQMANFLMSRGYKKIRQNGTSHAIYRNEKGRSLPLPNKRGEMSVTTMSLILNQCDSNRNELGKFLKCE